ncbi:MULTISPECIES: c-type cytochrome [unclassified Corallococcus]|uniref:c-type cytochrome n=1 Tax=unclassified Corallococcus TaxID=2685029 RepID=UPI001A8FDAC5|nr:MULTISPECIES: c-type cytochrome [unclassified Corallococcus]MBN9681041.1 c-type cytochrome [Corallococcus sp. NCSPR001]WAS87365.1 c-type cytochrome [Corallococcus sp. NCRR]
MRGVRGGVAALLVGVLAGCGGDTAGPVAAADYGEALFQDPGLSPSEYNQFSCATCHVTTPEAPGWRIDSGHTLYNVAARPSWWGGSETRLMDAVNFCYVNFMRGVTKLEVEEPRSRSLYEYLSRISPDAQAPALPFTVVKDIQDVPRGDVTRGEAVYQTACHHCHGAPHTGEGRLTDFASVLPEVTQTYDQVFPGIPHAQVVIEKVRHGPFFGVGGNMPLYSTEALSDADLGALLLYLGL